MLRAASNIIHTSDSKQRPTSINLVGNNLWGGWDDEYFFMTNENAFGRKTPVFDIMAEDSYPIDDAFKGGKIENFVNLIDLMSTKSYNLVPSMPFVEDEDVAEGSWAKCGTHATPAPTPSQVKMEAWLSVVHGAKGINWFNFFCGRSAEVEQEMIKFARQTTELADIFLGPETNLVINDNSNAVGNRVDTLVRRNGTDIWLFAVRLTEINSAGQPAETNDLSATFSIPSFGNGVAIVYDEGRQINVANGQLTDTFKLNEVHIYKISASLSQSKPGSKDSIFARMVEWFKGL